MHRLKLLLCALLIALAAGCSSGPSSNQPKYVGGNGLTFNSPVIIVGAKSLAAGFAAEKAWLAQHFPDAKITNQQFLPIADRRFDLFDLTTA
ncbi:MAG: hypothetical protein ABSH19_02660, partial [Opitutales bacterium]